MSEAITKAADHPEQEAIRSMVSVPIRLTRAMEDVISEEDWTWADLLAAAGAVTEAEYEESERQSQPAPAPQPAVPVVSDEQIIRAAVSAMPSTNPLVAEDLIGGHTMHTEAEDIVAIWRAGVQWQALHTATQPCGHPVSLVIRSAESGEALYCEACDDKSGRRDAEMREAELLEANQKLRDEILALRQAVEPMTEWEIADIFERWDNTSGASMSDFVRMVEAHHGITAKEEGGA